MNTLKFIWVTGAQSPGYAVHKLRQGCFPGLFTGLAEPGPVLLRQGYLEAQGRSTVTFQ